MLKEKVEDVYEGIPTLDTWIKEISLIATFGAGAVHGFSDATGFQLEANVEKLLTYAPPLVFGVINAKIQGERAYKFGLPKKNPKPILDESKRKIHKTLDTIAGTTLGGVIGMAVGAATAAVGYGAGYLVGYLTK